MLVQEILLRLQVLEELKSQKVNEIIRHSKPKRLIGEHVRNETVLLLVRELGAIQDQIEELTDREVINE